MNTLIAVLVLSPEIAAFVFMAAIITRDTWIGGQKWSR